MLAAAIRAMATMDRFMVLRLGSKLDMQTATGTGDSGSGRCTSASGVLGPKVNLGLGCVIAHRTECGVSRMDR